MNQQLPQLNYITMVDSMMILLAAVLLVVQQEVAHTEWMCLEVSTQVTQATMLTTQVHLLESELSIKTDRRIPLPRINSIITTTRAISQATETVRILPTLHTSLRSLRDQEVESLQVSMEERRKDRSLGITIWVRKREGERKIFMNLLNLIHTPTRYSSR